MKNIIQSRNNLPKLSGRRSNVGEGGCGVVGFTASIPVAGYHLLPALRQMENRGNGKGGGVALVGLEPEVFGITQQVLDTHYLICIAYLDPTVIDEIERSYLDSYEIAHSDVLPSIDEFSSIGLEVQPPICKYYFCRVKTDVLDDFIAEHDLQHLQQEQVEDEFVYQYSYKLNLKYYASLGEKRAFVLSHSKNLLVLKIVGYAHQVIQYYKLEKIRARVWIGHHRYPTKGTVWHPGGAHPFIGLNEALVHNGDFANYHAITEYLEQRNIHQLFLTDTEVAALQFDLYRRVYGYSTEYLIEAMAPTTEQDFIMLPHEKQQIYADIQHSHIHASPDGPWFFIIAANNRVMDQFELIGITDTSMLRPQVFAQHRGDVSIGLVASERQAIDAIMHSLSSEDDQIPSKADMYWNARGGSFTDGGAFVFSSTKNGDFKCADKFGNPIEVAYNYDPRDFIKILERVLPIEINRLFADVESPNQFLDLVANNVSFSIFKRFSILSDLLDHIHLLPNSTDGFFRGHLENVITKLLRSLKTDDEITYIDSNSSDELLGPRESDEYLILDVSQFEAEGEKSAANIIIKSYNLGWKRVISFDWRGQRFCGVGLGPNSNGFRIDTYGNPGDYLGSGLDGAEIFVHGSAQDQVGQIMRSGKIVVYGDVGQAFCYGAKGGEAYVLGNVAGRALINAGGSPKVIINGTALDYLAESFMAGDTLNGGGYIILNGYKMIGGVVVHLEHPYPGGNLFSLASGGAIFINDPDNQVSDDILYGGKFVEMSKKDYDVIGKQVEENNRLFHLELSLNGKLPIDGQNSSLVYKKIVSAGKVH